MPIRATRALLTAALSGDLNERGFRTDPNFCFDVPVSVKGVAMVLLDPRRTWEDGAAYDKQAAKLANMFADNFVQYEPFVDEEVMATAIKAQ